jgi:MFS family permease
MLRIVPGPAAVVAFLLFAVAWGANHFVPLLPVYRAVLGLSPTGLATVFGVYAVGLLPGLFLGGPLSDRVGRRAVVVPAALVALVGTAILGAASSSFGRLLLGRFVVGLGSGATFSAATAWVQDLALASRGQGARRAATALSAGFGGGPLVASVLGQWLPHPLVLPYVAQAAVLAVAVALVALVEAPAAAGKRAGGGGGRLVPAGFLREIVPVAPWVFGLPTIAFAVLPAAVRARVGAFPVFYTGVVTALTLLAGLLVQGPLRARSSEAAGRFGLAAGLGGLMLAAAAVRAVSAAGVLLAAPVLGAAYGGCLVSGLRFVETRSLPGDRGRVTGIFYVLAYLGFGAPLLLAALARRAGDTGAVLVAAALILLCLLLRSSPAKAYPVGAPGQKGS